VTFEATTSSVRAPGGQVMQKQVRFQRGSFADLKPGQNVVVCVKDGAAVKIRVVEPEPGRQGVN